MSEIGRRRVERHAARIKPRIKPSDDIVQQLVQHRLGQSDRDLPMVEGGSDAAGQLHAQARMTPAQQRLIARDHTGAQVDLGLVIGHDQVVGDDLARHSDHGAALLRLGAQTGMEQRQPPAPGRLRRVKGQVSGLEQLIPFAAGVAAEQRRAHADAAIERAPFMHMRSAQGFDQRLAPGFGAGRIAQRAGQKAKFVAAQATDDRIGRSRGLQPLGKGAQQRVAGIVAQ